jgi:predicted Zn-dependent peptidase
VVSVARASPFVALGVAVEAGSRHETHQSSGAAFALASTFLKVKKERKKERNQKQLLQNDATLLLKKKKKKNLFFFFFFNSLTLNSTQFIIFFFFFKIYKSSRTRSSLRVTRDLEAVSSDATAEATRDFVLYRATTSRESAASALTQLVDITAPALRHWEVEESHGYVALLANHALTDAVC